MATEMSAIDVLTNNLANVDTAGFKEDFGTLVWQAANPLSYGEGGLVRATGVLSVQTSLNLNQGNLQTTNNPLDLALQGQGMFGVRTAQGTVYTRNGQFHLSATRQLVSAAGNPVLGANGALLTLPDPQGQPIVVNATGAVQVGTTTVGQIGVFNAAGWLNAGNDTYTPSGTVTAATGATIQQGMLEMPNMDLSQTMGQLMGVERAYEAASQLQHTEDQIAQSAANDVGRVA
jgi:flagellar basal body rod protein FlgG